jgi:hypothetical protein
MAKEIKKERKHLSGLSLAFILDQTDMYGDVSGELQTF